MALALIHPIICLAVDVTLSPENFGKNVNIFLGYNCEELKNEAVLKAFVVCLNQLLCLDFLVAFPSLKDSDFRYPLHFPLLF